MRLTTALVQAARAIRREQFSQAVAVLTPCLNREHDLDSARVSYYLGLCWRGLHQPTVAASLFASALDIALSHGCFRLAARCRSQLLWELLHLGQAEAAAALLQESAQYLAAHPWDRRAQLRHENVAARHELLSGRPLQAASLAIEVAARAHSGERLLALETVLLAAECLGDHD